MTKIKRVQIISGVYPRPWLPEFGRFTANLAESWASNGVMVNVITSSTLSERLKNAKRAREEVSLSGVDVEYVKTIGTPFAGSLPKFLKNRLYRQSSDKLLDAMLDAPLPDLIYAQFAGAGVHALKAAKALDVPYFVDLGESWSLVSGDKDFVEENRNVLVNATGVVCVSPRLRDEALELGCDEHRVELVPNFPNWDRFRPLDKASCRADLQIEEDTFLVLYVGHFSERKGAPRLNIALHRMKQAASAAFLGSGDLEPDFPGIIQLGSVTHEKLPIWLNAADVLALPTLGEGCCNAIAEALACGLPVISSDIDDVRWQVPDQGSILLDPTDPDALASALDRLAADPSLVASMREQLIQIADVERDKNRSKAILDWMSELISMNAVCL